MLPTQSSPALALDSPSSIRLYFEKVRALVQSGEVYPVMLDDVWPLVYERKADAVESLQKNCLPEIDFRFFRKSPLKSKGRPTDTYQLTVACLEWFIARKVRKVFEVYREVFHHVVGSVVHIPQTGLIQLVNTLTDKVISLERRIDQIGKEQTTYFAAQRVSEQTANEIENRVKRERIIIFVRTTINRSIGNSWESFWERFELSYNVDIRGLKQNEGEMRLDTAIRNGYLNKIWEYVNLV